MERREPKGRVCFSERMRTYIATVVSDKAKRMGGCDGPEKKAHSNKGEVGVSRHIGRGG